MELPLRERSIGGWMQRVVLGLTGLTALAVGCWLPFVGRPLGGDEAGLLMVGGQLGEGSSLYGDYWVDRPPLLVGLFALASVVGGVPGVRGLGLLAVVGAVLTAGLLGRLAAPDRPRAALATAGVAAVILSSRMLGSGVVNGEVLAVPFVLAGLCTVVAALRHERGLRLFLLAVLAGLVGAAALLVKQSFADVFVFLVAVLAVELGRGQVGRARAALLASGALLGTVVTLSVVVGGAVATGSSLGDLWYAVVTFRGEATAVIAESATGDTPLRLVRLLGALVASGLVLVVAALVPTLARPVVSPHGVLPDLRAPAIAVFAWELFAVLLGGSYWLHYLIGLVPGTTLLVAAALQRPLRGRRALRAAVLVTVVSAAASIVFSVLHPLDRPERAPIAYLTEHAAAGETGIVAFGHPNILQAAGLRSPYPDLWSLPVRVRDPQLERLAAVLAGPDRPRWLVTVGDSLGTWGVDSAEASALVDRYYDLAAVTGDFRVYRLAADP